MNRRDLIVLAPLSVALYTLSDPDSKAYVANHQ
jgi:hypothetical protein